MKTSTRILIYSTVIGAYLVFGILGGWENIWPWGAVILGVPIIVAELFTQVSIRKRR